MSSGGLTLHPDLARVLEELRARRGFNADTCIEAKCWLLNAYCTLNQIKACVVGVSGGIDSAVTLALVAAAAKKPGSPIERVVAALLPLTVDEGATNQSTALARGRAVAERFGATVLEADLGDAHRALRASVERGLGTSGDAWAAGQLVSTIRTPALYYATSLLTQQGLPAVVVGTTNRDEGAFIGFFGKASDGMVDIQLVSDLHKSEIRAIARILDVPTDVIDATPTGDTYDGKTDEEMIGAPYDFIELYALWNTLLDTTEQQRIRGACSSDARAQFDALCERLRDRHEVNAHKYIGASPAVHLDVYERAVPGGWREDPIALPKPIDPTDFVGLFELDPPPRASSQSTPIAPRLARDAAFLVVDDVLTARECALLFAHLTATKKVPVGVNGKRNEYKDGDPVGSLRASAWSHAWSDLLWSRLERFVPRVRLLDELSSTDSGFHDVWRAVGVSPLLRFIWSERGGELVSHVDAGYDYGDQTHHTLMSVLIAVHVDGKAFTDFLLDTQRARPVFERNFDDRLERTLLERVEHRPGSALVFDHRMPHAGARYDDSGVRLLLRTDVVFARCSARALSRPSGLGDPSVQAIEELLYRGKTKLVVPNDVPAKVFRDPFYGRLAWRQTTPEAIEHAGYFDDGSSADDPRLSYDARLLVTPAHKLRFAETKKPSVVLVTTGALCPVHRGHIEMMEAARAALEKRGYEVAGGYLAPDHDKYVGMKCGADTVDAGERVRLCEEAVRNSDWLIVDPWAALHVERAVNFTDIIVRLERVIATLIASPRSFRVAYVFGSDNARFAETFAHRGLCVCVPRAGVDVAMPKESERVVVADQNVRAAASSDVRRGDDAVLDDRVRALWRARKSRGQSEAVVHVRSEGAWAVADWPDAIHAYARFSEGVVAAVRAAFADRVRIAMHHVDEQRAQLARDARDVGAARTLSLDPCVAGDANLGVSRCFDVGVGEPRAGVVTRPGWPGLDEQLRSIPPGSYVLVDDDVASGGTIAAVRALLPSTVTIEREIVLCDARNNGDDVVDLVDCRDFLAGARDAGLVLALHRGFVRAPYVFPYARPSQRMSAPSSSDASFSRAIWELNAQFFDDVRVRVRDTSPGFRALAAFLGFDDDRDMRDVVRWHLDRLVA